ncbi:competence type IV pilus minor pilin ComGF [Pediococcus inopinatus]|uniref:Prepilin-type N-terminal cleavage/methylation domain-containing protein n=1 Tax=Pediococcus inopinatus TaxID=114090 RepID=A0ABZ0Q2F7_9LACO|nr:competence type IV pilus minor pilin ComGF [Pediococcus inopinatus]WPC19337.1 prepilin-type N-terminal cleavage/methylation domain-containing protein [Pediococcus inopinatus]WPC21129.1 prepilin-type N-terminal cleavage/methylation domain-containing protein [Pediococcus inopinatus]WPP09943.1 competence type IV pilus minor pilin ComGF [Pediococcus inopinatus]
MNKKAGFTLIEVLASLVVLGMIYQLISFGSRLMNVSISQQSNSANWQLLVSELESAKHGFKYKSSKNNYVYLDSVTENKVYKLEKYQDELRFSPGYVPLIVHVEIVNFDYQEPFLKLQIKFKNGEIKKENVYIPKK